MNNIKEVQKLLEIPSKDLKPEINIKDDNGKWSPLYRLHSTPLQLSELELWTCPPTIEERSWLWFC